MFGLFLVPWVSCLGAVSILFAGSAEAVDAGCGGQLTQEAGQIVSPNFPNGYPDSTRCSWVITVQPDKVVDFTFLSLDLEGTDVVCADYVVLRDGPSQQDPILSGSLCLSSSERHYRSQGNQMLVSFYSDSSISRPGFTASYKTLDCKPFTYGSDVCDKPCTCKHENTLYCNSVNGHCNCKTGWTSTDCSLDINECLDPQTCPDLYTTCVNRPGSYECNCRPGMTLNSTGYCEDLGQCKVKNCSHACDTENSTETCFCPRGMKLSPMDDLTCQECDNWKYGEDCAFECKCYKSRTQSCDKVNGLCSCYLNWTSTDCTQNVNECGLEKPPCDTKHSQCYDTTGSFECRCLQGYEHVSNETTCEECGRTLTDPSGIIISNAYNYYYSHSYSDQSITCNWTIEVNKSDVISFRFVNLYNTHVEIYDGDDTYARLLDSSSYRYNIYQPSNIIRSSSNRMHIVRRSLYYSGSFTATYWSHECPEFKWGQNCTDPCNCVKNNTEYCDSTTGLCVCNKAWKSRDCSVDVDECLDDPLACPDFSDCHNLHGSYQCTCKAGLVNTSTGCALDPSKGYCAQPNCSQICVNVTGPSPTTEQCYCPIGMMLHAGQCVECQNMTYGPECSHLCQCVHSNTFSCDPQTGTCKCLNTWTGADCSNDIDECYLRIDKCDAVASWCSNTPGGYRCICRNVNGYEESDNGTCVKIDCSHTLTDTSGNLSSPNYPQQYFNYAKCSWNITVADGDVVSFRFSFLEVDNYNFHSKCDKDYVSIYDGKDRSARLIGQYCVDFPKVIRSTGNSMFIEFISDSYNTKQGFNASYTSHACPEFMYGDEFCDKNCSCNEEHTQFCDSTNGACICQSGWIGGDCSTDLDECQDTRSGICPPNSDCINTAGSFTCECHAGFALNESANFCVYNPTCERKKCSHTCYMLIPTREEKCGCPEDLVLDQAEGLFCVVPYYPYGVSANDEQISPGGRQNTSVTQVNFGSGVPFGINLQVTATVHFNGLISFDNGRGAITGTPDLTVALDIKLNVVAPYWANTNPKRGQVFHKLYEKCETSIFGDSAKSQMSPNKTDVMRRLEKDISTFHNLPGFEVNSALVVTWEKLRPYSISSEEHEENTFQAVYVTGWTKENKDGKTVLQDEETSYVIFLYQQGMMNWPYVPGRPISIGTTGLNFHDLKDTDTSTVAMLGKVLGNTGLNGVWTYKVGSSTGPKQKCHKYVCSHADLISNPIYQDELNRLYKCPCTLERLGRQWQLYEKRGEKQDIYCYAISAMAKHRLLQGNKRNKLCCYRWNKPNTDDWREWERSWREASYLPTSADSGHVLINDLWSVDPFDNFQAQENIQAHQWCCRDSNRAELCSRFYKIFPDMGCSNFVEFVPASALGDPHITTLDGITYTMNGWGEYVMMEIPSENFTLQARTGRAESATGSVTNATVFTAFAASESNYSHFQVELAWTNTSMVVIANGMDLTNDFYKNIDFTFSRDAIIVTRESKHNRTDVVTTLPCGVTIKVHVGVKSLEIELEVDKNLQNKTRGLLGNFNGNLLDEFSLPNGTVLSSNLSQRGIYEHFAKEWAVTAANSVFVYDELESSATYQHPDFVPIFLDELDQSEVDSAKDVCGDAANDACIFDYLVTRDKKFAANTRQVKEQQKNITQSLENRLPTLALKSNMLKKGRWVVNHGQEAVIQVDVSDDDNDQVALQIVGSAVGVAIFGNGTISYTSNMSVAITLGVQGLDSKGGYSPVLFIPISSCPNCSGHGHCDETGAARQVEYDNGYYQVLRCICEPAYTGMDCEHELDGCKVKPCSVGQNCTDIPADQQGNSSIGYICGPCPPGFSDFDGKCADINECNSSSECEQICTNTEGSYFCGCRDGYRLNTDKTTCTDIDECEERIAKCQQECINTYGSYNCSCREDYKLDTDGRSCKLDSSYINQCSKCDQVCTIKEHEANCSCHVGYEPDPNNHSKCIDTDECKIGVMPCTQVCTNTPGWFKCECYLGYKLQTDGISCIACDQPHYGKDCASRCSCLGRGTCDPVRGCVCVEQWTGVNCELDVDECDSPTACPVGQLCRNEEGTYSCLCPDGYRKENGVCKDIDECSGPEAVLRCQSTENCINTEGNYICECKPGFARDSNLQCQDIDECKRGTTGCEQICENVPGLYNCKCYPGYKLSEDRRACRKDRDLCGQDLNCSHGCSINQESQKPFCYCPLGYSLVSNITCEDINECNDDSLNLCSYKTGCVNTNGSFTCSCEAGSKLDNDGRSCVGCRGGTWGLQCANSCACGIGGDHCDPVIGCVCRPGFTGKQCSDDINECDNGQVKCGHAEMCVNLPGTAICVCQDGYENITGVCHDIDECSNTTTNNCSQVCNNYEGSFTCSCYPGYVYDSDLNTCSDINECDLPISKCEQGCVNTQGSYRCTCEQGMQLQTDGLSCVVDKATCINKTCSETCVVINGVATCFCGRGKKLSADNYTCTDADLCANHRCKFACVETHGNTSYECLCNPGTQLSADGVTCVDCIKMKWGPNCTNSCDCVAANTQECNKVSGNCTCKDGWTGSRCEEDVDECLNSGYQCPTNSDCHNTYGGYTCACRPGYIKRNESSNLCEECDENFYGESCLQRCKCGTNFACDKVNGLCQCSPGWTGVQCDTDLDECSLQTHNCDSLKHEQCFNIDGGYSCECEPGTWRRCDSCLCQECEDWKFGTDCKGTCQCQTNTSTSCNKINGACTCQTGWTGSDCKQDEDECQIKPTPCPDHSDCHNQMGNYSCRCNDGYTWENTNKTCQECEDWKFGTDCKGTCQCQTNTSTSCNKTNGACTCQTGWTGSDCKQDEDECQIKPTPCPDHLDCHNQMGNYSCRCNDGYTWEDTNKTCQECEDWKFGTDCKEICQCQTNTSTYCNKTNGTCTCQTGWTGSDCKQDEDECQIKPTPCPDHSDCRNQMGTYSCICNVGYTWEDTIKTCQECEDWKFGTDCKEICQCQTNTSTSCNKTNGACTCQTGWTGSDCKQDEDECQIKPTPCPDHSDCRNQMGTYSCICNVGYTWENTNKTCQECEDWKFGTDCKGTCQCQTNTSTSCNKINGACTCQTGWTGSDCKQDEDECQIKPTLCPDHSDCRNQMGTYSCICNDGYTWDDTNTTCLEETTVFTQVTLDFNVTIDLTNKESTDYKKLKEQVQQEIELKLTMEMKVKVNVTVIQLSKGSLNVDLTVTFPTTDVSSSKKLVASAVSGIMVRGGFEINNKTTPIISAAVAGTTFKSSESICDRMNKFELCDTETICEEKDNVAVCRPIKEKSKTEFKLGMGLGVSLFIVLCVVIGALAYYWTWKQKKSTGKGEKKDNESLELQWIASRARPSASADYSPFHLPTQDEEVADRRSRHSSRWSHHGESERGGPSQQDKMSEGSHYYSIPRIPRVRKIVS